MTLAQDARGTLAAVLKLAGPTSPTLCDGWQTADLAAHLLVRETSIAALGLSIPAAGQALRRAMDRAKARESYDSLVDRFAAGPGRRSPWRLIDAVANTVEFFVHTEDVLRAGDWDGHSRSLDPRVEDEIWKRLRGAARLLYRRSPVPITLFRDGTGETIRAKRGTGGVRVTGDPGEVALHAFGRGRVAEVRLAGPPESIEALKAAALGAF
jgi:uncharacterized protein (TIGR03085 family)